MSRAAIPCHLAYWLANVLPGPVAFGVAECLADLQWRCSPAARRSVRMNLSLVLGREIGEYAPSVRNVFRNFARYLVEFFTVHRLADPEVSWEGRGYLDQTLRECRRAIALTAHLGNWELAAVLVRRTGVLVRAVALPHAQSRLDRLFNRQRERCGLEMIAIGPTAAHRSLHALRREGLLGLLGDWALGDEGIQVTLCGQSVWFPRGPALLSLRSRTPILPIFLIREGTWKFRLCIEPPIHPPPGRQGLETVRALTQAYASALERHLRRDPEQWLLFHPVAPLAAPA